MARIRRSSTKNNTNNALRSFISFQKRGTVDDGYGNMVPGGAFVNQFSMYANFRPLLRGSATGVEDVFADRLQGNQPYILTIRNNPILSEVTTAWRIVDIRSFQFSNWILSSGFWDDNGSWLEEVPWDSSGAYTKVYNIKSPPTDVTNSDLWREFIVVQDQPS
jgi:head-tail adaptor